jgi:PAS domain S-box-containing protein
MGEFLQRLFVSDFMPHGACWQWEPWVVWSNVVSDAVLALCYMVIPVSLVTLARRRRDVLFNPVAMMFGAFIFCCGCTHALEVYNTWNGVFRLAGVVKAVTAVVSLLTLFPLLAIMPKLLATPPLAKVLDLDAALSSEQREKSRVAGQLRESEDRFQLLVDGIKDYAVILLDPEGLVTSWNPGAERIHGFSAGEILGCPNARFFPEEELATGKPEALLRAAAARGRVEVEGWRLRKDGSRFLAHVVLTAFHDGGGAVRGFAKVVRDVTESRAAQAALRRQAEQLEDQVRARVQDLRESEARLQGFIRHSSAAIAFRGPDGRYLLINPRMAALLGLPAEAIIGRTAAELFPDDDAVAREQDQKVLQTGQDLQAEVHWVRPDGAEFDLLVEKFPLVDGTGPCWGVGIISTDITGRKRAELALLQSQKLESLGVLAGGIAHDFNNLLGAMRGNAELALAEASPPLARPYLETLLRLISRGSDLLRAMLAYSGQGKPSMRIIDLNQLVLELTQLMGTSISKKANLSLQLHPQPLPLAADPGQIQQLVMNLVINGSEALGDHNGVLTLRTALVELAREDVDPAFAGEGLRPGPHVLLEVADDGIGMAPEVLARIFEPFFTTKFTGRGLGLAAIHGIVRGHRGAIRVSSQPGRGSRFKILFPAAQGEAVPAATEPLLPGLAAAPGGERVTVLVVDDEDEMRAVMVTALDRAGFQTLQARCGLEALGQFQQHRNRIRLILMDLTMPTLDGEETCRELRRMGSEVPVILNSGFSEEEALGRFKDLELAGFLQKPFALAAMVEMVRKVLDESHGTTGGSGRQDEA